MASHCSWHQTQTHQPPVSASPSLTLSGHSGLVYLVPSSFVPPGLSHDARCASNPSGLCRWLTPIHSSRQFNCHFFGECFLIHLSKLGPWQHFLKAPCNFPSPRFHRRDPQCVCCLSSISSITGAGGPGGGTISTGSAPVRPDKGGAM